MTGMRKREMVAQIIRGLIARFPKTSDEDIAAAVLQLRKFPMVPVSPDKSMAELLVEMVAAVRREIKQPRAAQ
jgi:hypothetical protein